MNLGTDVYFIWNEPHKKDELIDEVSSLLSLEGCVRTGIGEYWSHDIIGAFSVTALKRDSEKVDSICLCFDCELLPELNDPGFERPELPPRTIYHMIKRLFISLNAECCCAATQTDGVAYFNFADPLISRVFKFTKSGPQRLIRPFEEDRPVAFSDLARDPITDEPAWVMQISGQLA